MSNENGVALKTPPHNLEAERAVLASIIIDANIIDELTGLLHNDDFYFKHHQLIYDALKSLNDAKKPLDMVTLVTKLNDDNTIEHAGGFDYIADLVKHIPNAANALHYAENIKEKATLRKMITAGGKITELAYDNAREVGALIDEAQQVAYQLGETKTKSDVEHVKEVLVESYARLEELYNNLDAQGISGITSGFPDLDGMTDGFQRSDLIILAGRPGMGKTSLALNILYNAAAAGKACVFFSLEMSAVQLANRLMSCEAQIKLSKLRTGDLNNDEWKRFATASSKISAMDIYLDATSSITVNMIRSRCRKLKSKGKLDIVFVDYLQIMGVNDRITNREQQLSEISRNLKSLAKELDVPVIALAQVNRAIEGRTDNKRPRLSDLRESGAIEQDADIVMFIYRDEVYNKETVYKNLAEIIIEKYRNGEPGSAFVSFDGEFTKFGLRPVDLIELKKSVAEKAAENAAKRGKKSDND